MGNVVKKWSGIRRLVAGGLAGVAVVFCLATPADATWAVVAADPETKEVGVAFASCLDPEVLGDPEEPLIPMVFSPGLGGAIYTDTVDTSVEAEILGLLSQDLSPDQILNNVTAVENESRARGQYAVVTVDGASAVRSGSAVVGQQNNGASYTVHGNEVASGVVEAVTASLEADRGTEKPLSDVVVDALVAGAAEGGDVRCGDQTALFAQVVVVGPEDTPTKPGYFLTVVVDQGDGQNPVEILAQERTASQQGLFDVGTASGRGIWVYAFAATLGLMMLASGAVIFRYGMGNRVARR